MKQSDTRDQSLNKKAETWPAVCERCKESLQGSLPEESKAMSTLEKPLMVEDRDPTFGWSEGDDATF